MLSCNFQISDDCLVGIDQEQIKRFLRTFALTHKKNRLYVLKIVEVTASQLIVNYYGACLSEASKLTSYTRDEIEVILKNYLYEIVRSGEYLDYDSSFLTKEFVDKNTGEMVKPQVKSFSKLTNTQYAAIIDLLSVVVKNINPEFKILDPKNYTMPTQGQKNELDFPELKFEL